MNIGLENKVAVITWIERGIDKVAIQYLKKQGGGKIITIGSGLGHKGRANNAAYSCSKAEL